jgi:hypothetical protein
MENFTVIITGILAIVLMGGGAIFLFSARDNLNKNYINESINAKNEASIQSDVLIGQTGYYLMAASIVALSIVIQQYVYFSQDGEKRRNKRVRDY